MGPSDAVSQQQFIFLLMIIVWNLIVTAGGIGLFAFKFYKLSKMIRKEDKPNNRLLRTVKKQCKLAFIVLITSILLYVTGSLDPILLDIDNLINAITVYCSFSFALNLKLHRLCCECNGNKYLLCCCCYCCICCNETAKNSDIELKVSSANNTETKENKLNFETITI